MANTLKVIYCVGWGYLPKAQSFATALIKLVGESVFGNNILLEATPTTSGAFEVIVNGKTLHSKLNGDGYVGEEKLKQIANYMQGK